LIVAAFRAPSGIRPFADQPFGGCAWPSGRVSRWPQRVYGVGEDGVTAFTKYGIECLQQIIADERAARRAPLQVNRPNSRPAVLTEWKRCSDGSRACIRTCPVSLDQMTREPTDQISLTKPS
jgi:hypothetical protein